MSSIGSRRRRRQRRVHLRLYGVLRWWVRGVMNLHLRIEDGALMSEGGSWRTMRSRCKRCGRLGREHWTFRGCWRFKR